METFPKTAKEVSALTDGQCGERLMAMKQALFKVAYGLLDAAADREDAVSEAMRKALLKHRWLRDEAKFEAWAMRIMINECYTLLRKKKRELPMAELPERIAPESADRALHDAILALPTDMRLPVILHYMDGYALGEVSAMLRVPVGTLKSRLSRARAQLRDALAGEGCK